MATRTRTAEEVAAEEENEVTTPEDLGFKRREVEVEHVAPPTEVGQDGLVEVRMGRTIDEFTFGNPHFHHKLEEGHIYRMPVDIARYLYSLGALSNRL